MRKTKIICTLGPSTDDDDILRQLMIEGMNECCPIQLFTWRSCTA